MISSPELWQAVIPVVDVLEALGVPWHVGGSVARWSNAVLAHTPNPA